MSAPERVAVVTGGGSGIGLATCSLLAAAGFTLAVLDLDLDAAKAAAGTDGTGYVADVSDADAVDQAFTEIFAAFGRIDVLINNAGITGGPTATICHETPVDVWERVQAINSPRPFLFAGGAAGDARAGIGTT